MGLLRDGSRAKETRTSPEASAKTTYLNDMLPESFRNVKDSKEEMDVPKGACYSALELSEGTALIDPKLRRF